MDKKTISYDFRRILAGKSCRIAEIVLITMIFDSINHVDFLLQ